MDVDHVDFTVGGGGDVDMTDESDRPPPRRSSPRLAPNNNEASSSTSAQTQSGEYYTTTLHVVHIATLMNHSLICLSFTKPTRLSNTGDTASTAATTSVVTLNGKTLPHVHTAVHLPPPHNHESYGNHPQLREHEDCPGDSCTRGSCILRRMIPQMKPGGDLDYNYDEKRIVVNQFYPQLRELKCSLLLKVLKEVDKLPDPPSDKSKSTKTTNKKSKTIVRREDTYTSSQMNAMKGTIIIGLRGSGLTGQEGYDTVLEINGEYADEWAVSTPSEKEVIMVSQVSDHLSIMLLV